MSITKKAKEFAKEYWKPATYLTGTIIAAYALNKHGCEADSLFQDEPLPVQEPKMHAETQNNTTNDLPLKNYKILK